MVVGRLHAGAFDRVIMVNAHLHRTGSIHEIFPTIEATNLSAMPAIAATLRVTGLDPATVIIGPDAESQPWVSELASRLGVAGSVAHKNRRNDRSVEVVLAEPKAVVGRPVSSLTTSSRRVARCSLALAASLPAALRQSMPSSHMHCFHRNWSPSWRERGFQRTACPIPPTRSHWTRCLRRLSGTKSAEVKRPSGPELARWIGGRRPDKAESCSDHSGERQADPVTPAPD
jgi:hypothetical protein